MADATPSEHLPVDTAPPALVRFVGQPGPGHAPLGESIALYGRGALLKAHCEAGLEQARLQVAKIVIGPSGEAAAEPARFE